MAMRTLLTIQPARAYSRRYRAARTPIGRTTRVMSSVIVTVPKMAG